MGGSGSSKERYGLFDITNGFNDSAKYEIDIVAVHGLGGHWLDTWKAKNGAVWLRDFLPDQFKTARVRSFGYDSRVAPSSNVTDISDVAKMLLETLRGERQLDKHKKKRPIIFIAHSLGGIVVKKALIEARLDLARYSDLLGSVSGLVFFGVPHCGSDAASWAHFAAKLSKSLLLGRINKEFVRALEKGSGILTEISQQFLEQDSSILIRTFYETRTMFNL